MKPVSPRTVTASALVVFFGLLAMYIAESEVPTQENREGTETTLGPSSPSPIPLPDDERAEAASNGRVEPKPPMSAPPKEGRNRPTLADPPAATGRSPKPGRHVIYVQVEAELVPSGADKDDNLASCLQK